MDTRYFEVGNEEDWSPTLRDSINLAINILKWTETRLVMVELNLEDSHIDLLFDEIEENPIVIRRKLVSSDHSGKDDKEPEEDEKKQSFFYGIFYHNEPEALYLNRDLISLCKAIQKDDNDYRRLIFFVAMVILNELSHNYRRTQGYLEPLFDGEEEAGAWFVFQMLGGTLDLEYDINKRDVVLKLSVDQMQIEVDSPTAHASSTNPPSRESIETGLNVYTGLRNQLTPVCTTLTKVVNLKIDFKVSRSASKRNEIIVKIFIENIHDEFVLLPKNFKSSFFNISLKSINQGSIDKKIHLKGSSLMRKEDLKNAKHVKPNETITYSFKLKNMFLIQLAKADLYTLTIKYFALYHQENTTYSSNKLTKHFLLDDEDKDQTYKKSNMLCELSPKMAQRFAFVTKKTIDSKNPNNSARFPSSKEREAVNHKVNQ